MDLTAFIHGLGSISLFSSRAFLPAFFTAVTLRYGDLIPIISGSDLVKSAGSEPTWFTSNWMIFALGVLSILEIIGDKNAEVRQHLHDVTGYIKSSLALLTYLGVISVSDTKIIEKIITNTGFFDMIPAVFIGYGVYVLNSWRLSAFSNLIHADEDDELGLQTLISWADDLFATFGVLIIILFPY